MLSVLDYRFYGAPGAIPTRDLPLRRRTLYATELREPNGKNTVNRSQETEGLLTSVFCLLSSRLIRDQRPDVVTFEFLSAGQKFQLDHKHQADNCSAQSFD